jgi:hypothetical protein
MSDLQRSGQELVDDLRGAGVTVGPGLSDDELAAASEAVGAQLPDDLAGLLRAGVPAGDRFAPWRGPLTRLAELSQLPIRGLLFDVEHNGLWLEEWGARPGDQDKALALAAEQLAQVPVLLPLYANRYLPSTPRAAGNPVLAVHQADIVIFGADLADYLAREFGLVRRIAPPASSPPKLPFWGLFLN